MDKLDRITINGTVYVKEGLKDPVPTPRVERLIINAISYAKDSKREYYNDVDILKAIFKDHGGAAHDIISSLLSCESLEDQKEKIEFCKIWLI